MTLQYDRSRYRAIRSDAAGRRAEYTRIEAERNEALAALSFVRTNLNNAQYAPNRSRTLEQRYAQEIEARTVRITALDAALNAAVAESSRAIALLNRADEFLRGNGINPDNEI